MIAGSGSAVLFVHGFPGWWYTWAAVMDALRKRHLVIAVDLPGHGRSPSPRDPAEYTLPCLLAGVRRCLDAARAHPLVDAVRPPLLVGHDWGAVIGWALADTAPELLSGLVTVGMPHPQRLREAIAVDPSQRAASAYAQRLLAGGAPPTAEEAVDWIVSPSESGERDAHLAALLSTSPDDVVAYYRANAAAHRLPVPRRPPELPVLQVHGLEDRFCLPSSFAAPPPLNSGPVTTIAIPGGDHFVHVKHARQVAAEITCWGTAAGLL